MKPPVNLQALSHGQRVRFIYKRILRLHRGLPLELRAIGDEYVKQEFRLHKAVSEQQAYTFMREWTMYGNNLAKDLSLKGIKKGSKIGRNLTEDELEDFNDDQVQQLYELMSEAKEVFKPGEAASKNS